MKHLNLTVLLLNCLVLSHCLSLPLLADFPATERLSKLLDHAEATDQQRAAITEGWRHGAMRGAMRVAQHVLTQQQCDGLGLPKRSNSEIRVDSSTFDFVDSLPILMLYPTADGAELEAHVFTPADDSADMENRSCILYFHGGGWRTGGPEDGYTFCRYFQEKGFVAISVQYRIRSLYGGAPVECVLRCMEDAKAAMEWVCEIADSLGINTGSLILAGSSAGGHLATSVPVFGFNSAGDWTESSSDNCAPKALLLYNPVVHNGPGGGYAYRQFRKDYKRISPFHNIDFTLPPVFIVAGKHDKTARLEHLTEFRKKLKSKGGHAEILALPGGHGVLRSRHKKAALEHSESFLKNIGIWRSNE